MKKVIDFNGNTIEVSIDTPVKTVNGVHYLLSNADRMEITKREQEATKRAAELKAKEYIEKRKVEYGTIEQQIEYITENGLDAWQKKVSAIKVKYPKK